MDTIDLTGGEVKVIGNRGDIHLFRLSNPESQQVIAPDKEYEAEFISSLSTEFTEVEMDTSEVITGSLIIPVTITAGTYTVRCSDPRRTLLIIEVEVR